MAWFTFGEGYHNFHHEFQHDYRNGVKAWQFDPTKWCIWLLAKLALVGQLRRVSEEKILLAEAAEQRRQLAANLSCRPTHVQESLQRLVHTAQARLQQASKDWEDCKFRYRQAATMRVEASRESLDELRREMRAATARLKAAWREWQNTRRFVNEV